MSCVGASLFRMRQPKHGSCSVAFQLYMAVRVNDSRQTDLLHTLLFYSGALASRGKNNAIFEVSGSWSRLTDCVYSRHEL